jgi:ankyrin repeat protein
MLVENGADPEIVDQKGNNALYYAIKYQKFDCVKNIFDLYG